MLTAILTGIVTAYGVALLVSWGSSVREDCQRHKANKANKARAQHASPAVEAQPDPLRWIDNITAGAR
jgi:hypothetical protein